MLKFGKKYRVGNFYLLKITRSLSKDEYSKLRDDAGIPKEYRYGLRRAGMPVIVVGTISDNWKVMYTPFMNMFMVLDNLKVNEKDDLEDLDTVRMMVNFIYYGSTILGDGKFYGDMMKVYGELSERAVKEGKLQSEEESQQIIKEEEIKMKAEEDIRELAKDLKEEVDKVDKKPKKKKKVSSK